MACPGTAAFMQQAALALEENKLLGTVAIPFADQPNAGWRQACVRMANKFGIDLERELKRRAIHPILEARIRQRPFWELLRTFVSRVDKDGRLSDRIFEYGNASYDRWVARDLVRFSKAVYGFEYGCLEIFQKAERLRLPRIYDVPATEHDWWHQTLVEQTKQYPETSTPFLEYTFARHQERTERRRTEFALADRVICNSEYAKMTFTKGGYDASKIRVVPYGAPPVHDHALQGGTAETGKARLKILWAGSFSLRKGAHLLLSAWRRWQHSNDAELHIFGSQQLPSRLLENLPSNVILSPTIPRSELESVYLESDVFVFPTLCDGFGMVVTESLAHGLPVITTPDAGASQFISHGQNGFIIPTGDVEAIIATLEWCRLHRDSLRQMRSAAAECARRWQWSDYRKALSAVVNDSLDEVTSKRPKPN